MACGNGQSCDSTTFTCASWQLRHTEQNHDAMWGAWAVAPGDAYFAGSRTSGFVHVAPSATAYGYIEAVMPSSVYATGDGGPGEIVVAGYWQGPGGAVRVLPAPWDGGFMPGVVTTNSTVGAFDTVFPVATDLYIAGEGSVQDTAAVFVRDGGGWTSALPNGLTGAVMDGFGVGPGEYFVVTRHTSTGPRLGHRKPDGGFESWPLPSTAYSLWGTPQGTLWLAGANLFARAQYDGGLSILDAGAGAVWSSVWATSDTNVYLAGREPSPGCPGLVVRYDGATFLRTCLNSMPMRAVTGTGPLDVWASGDDGGIWHYGP